MDRIREISHMTVSTAMCLFAGYMLIWFLSSIVFHIPIDLVKAGLLAILIALPWTWILIITGIFMLLIINQVSKI